METAPIQPHRTDISEMTVSPVTFPANWSAQIIEAVTAGRISYRRAQALAAR